MRVYLIEAIRNRRSLFGAWLLVVCVSAAAQDFPRTAPLRILGFAPPGAQSDILTRALIPPLSRALGQTVIVENRPGADGAIAAEQCAKSAPDGHTLCFMSSSILIVTPATQGTLPYNPLSDFAPVMFLGYFDSFLIAHPSVAANNLNELVAQAKADANKLNWGHFGLATVGNFYQEYIRKFRGAPFFSIPYKTNPQLLQALQTGEAQVGVFGVATVVSPIRAGKLKALAVTADKRVVDFPNVPTFEEEGIKLPFLRGWYGYNMAAATPRPIVMRWNAELRRAMAEPFYAELLAKQRIEVRPGAPEELDALLKTQLKQFAELVKYIDFKPQ